MNTKNHKSATTSDILPADPATNPSSEALLAKEDPRIQKYPNPFPLRGRCGKVARLPKEIRDQLNEMLLDGIPHAQIIQKLRENFGTQPSTDSNVVPIISGDATSNPVMPTSPISDSANHGIRNTQHVSSSDSIENPKSKIENLDGLTPHHITTWKKFGGYRDWLRDQQRIADCKLRHELTLDLARNAEGLASYQAAPKVAVAQMCQTIIDLGPAGLKDAMQASPLNCFRLLNALARLINSGLKCETQIIKHAAETRPKPKNGFTPDVVEQMETQLNMF